MFHWAFSSTTVPPSATEHFFLSMAGNLENMVRANAFAMTNSLIHVPHIPLNYS
jgi:hypothetical protein